MENSRTTLSLFKIKTLLLCLGIIGQSFATIPINIPIQSVSNLLIQSALNSLNQDSPTRHTYKSGNLISAQKLLQPPYMIYRLTLSLEPDCKEESSCPREACVIDLKQNEQGVIEVDEKTAQCMYLYPQWNQDDNKQSPSSERLLDPQEQEIIDNLDKQITNDSVKLDHEVQDVTDQNDRPFIAVRASHYCPGCPYELNPTLPGLETFREVAALSMDRSERSNYKHKVISIIRITRAVPPGSDVVRYELLMEIGQTNCLITMSIHRGDCTLSNEPIQLCLLTFDERPWLSHNRQLTRNNCTESYDRNDNSSGNIGPNLVSESLTNSDVDIDEGDVTKSEIYDQIAQEGQISTYESPVDASLDAPIPTAESGNRDELMRAEITETPFTQIVHNRDDIEKEPVVGFTDKLREFDEFLKNFDIPVKDTGKEKSLSNGQEVIEEIIRPEHVKPKVNIQKQEPNVELSRKKRSSVIRRSSDSKFVLKLAQKAMNLLDEIDQDDKKRVVVKVLGFKKTESTDGIINYITILAATTNCEENKVNIKYCVPEQDKSLKICKLQVYTNDENSLESAQIRLSECHDNQKTRGKRAPDAQSISGGQQSIPIDDEVKNHVKAALKHYSATAGGDNEPLLIEIISATSQVVAGKRLSIRVKIGESNCPKGQAADTCLLVENSPIKECLISVWSQLWLNKPPEITVNCESSNSRKRRSLRGVNYSNKMLNLSQGWKDQTNYDAFQNYEQDTAQYGPTKFDENNLESVQTRLSEYHDNQKMRSERAARGQSIPGGQQSIPIDDEVKNHVKAALKHYSAIAGGDNESQLIEIMSATRQVVSGTLLRIRVKIGESNCPKGQAADTCLLVENSPVKECLITVWSQPWLNKPPKITVNCESSSSRKKRSLRGVNYSNKMLDLSQDWKDQTNFDAFQKKYNRAYSSQEEQAKRYLIFKTNMRIAEKFQEYEQGTAQYGPTKFADMTQQEFHTYTGYRSDLKSENEIPYPMAEIPDIKLDPEFDWRQYNVVTPVKNQGSCGSCWAFSVTGNVEGQYAIKHKNLLSLSEQELVDCDKLDEGCNGGLQENAYRALEKLGGLELEEDYPYDGEDEKCHFKKSKARVQVVSAVNITSNETQMAQWLVKNGPMAIGINANAMQFYMGGISHPLSFLCNKDSLDHGVLIVGYGIHTYPIFKRKYPYWIVKNSWGSNWGEQGYYRVYRGDGTCGLNTDVTSAIVA